MSDTVDTDPLVALANAFPGAITGISGSGYVAEKDNVQLWLDHGDSHDNEDKWIAELSIAQTNGVTLSVWRDGPNIQRALAALATASRVESEEEEKQAFEQYQQAKATRERVAKLFP